jgi:hypothetical protein
MRKQRKTSNGCLPNLYQHLWMMLKSHQFSGALIGGLNSLYFSKSLIVCRAPPQAGAWALAYDLSLSRCWPPALMQIMQAKMSKSKVGHNQQASRICPQTVGISQWISIRWTALVCLKQKKDVPSIPFLRAGIHGRPAAWRQPRQPETECITKRKVKIFPSMSI